MKYATRFGFGMAERRFGAYLQTAFGRRALGFAAAIGLTLGMAPPAWAQPREPQTAPGAAGRGEAAIAPLDPEELVVIGAWRVATVGGRPVAPGSRAGLRLDGQRISGHTGCNSLGGNYRYERGFLTTGGVITSRRVCAGALARQEATLLSMLDQRLSVRPCPGGRLLLKDRDGTMIVLVRIEPGTRSV